MAVTWDRPTRGAQRRGALGLIYTASIVYKAAVIYPYGMSFKNDAAERGPQEPPPRLLVVDDDEDDFFLLKTAMAAHPEVSLESIVGGRQLFERLEWIGPARLENLLILLDLHMPEMDGFETLIRLRSHPRWRLVPVVVWSSAAHEDDFDRLYSLGANCVFKKPLHFNGLLDLGKSLARYLSGAVVQPVQAEAGGGNGY